MDTKGERLGTKGGISLKSPEARYERRKEQYGKLIRKQIQSSNRISNGRVAVFFVGIAASILLYRTGNFFLAGGILASTVILFVYLVAVYRHILRHKKYTEILVQINQDSLKRLRGGWKGFKDTGEDFLDENHPYSWDLDIFGQGSLFQWINTAHTPSGRQKIGQAFIRREDSIPRILNRQRAIDELAEKVRWRQWFMAEGRIVREGMEKTEQFFDWMKDRDFFIVKPEIKAILRILPFITGMTGILALFELVIPYQIPVSLLILHYILLAWGKKRRMAMLRMAERYEEDIQIYGKMLEWIENQEFRSDYLRDLKGLLVNKNGKRASHEIKRLSRIVDSISNRSNMFFFIVNLITLWEYHSFIALEEWKVEAGERVEEWLDTIGEFEALSSLAIIRFDHPDWTIPSIGEGVPRVAAKAAGHPLLGQERVCNDVRVQEPHSILLITGSNMSGKSTLLRTVGVNLVLAYAGAPVCAREFHCTLMDLYTCMRVRDNLEMSISSFYAELLRIRRIIEAVEQGKKVFFLLDEIFKGTNSQDRHTGARVLIRRLGETGNLGMVSTHDLELGSMEKERGSRVKNYHFSEHYKDNKIFFDYKLKPGISTTRNARYLMRLAGIEIEYGE